MAIKKAFIGVVIVAILASGFATMAVEMCPSFSREAIESYRRKADAGDAEAQYLYAYALLNGGFCPPNPALSLKYAAMASKQGFGAAYSFVARGYKYGYGIESNAVKAAKWESKHFEWAKAASERGNPMAQWALGKCYQFGMGIKEDHVEAEKWYRKSANQGYAFAQVCIGQIYSMKNRKIENEVEKKKNCAIALRWFEEAARQGDALAQYELGMMLSDTRDRSKDNVKEGIKWYRKSAEQGYSFGQYALALSYENGFGVEQNSQEALRWYRESAERGNNYSIKHLAEIYIRGYGRFGIDKNEAAKWLDKLDKRYIAFERKNLSALMLDLGLMYAADGNDDDTEKWLQMASQCGNAEAIRFLSLYKNNKDKLQQYLNRWRRR